MKLVADANVLLAAVLGGRARVLLEHPGITEILTSEFTLAEVQEYTAQLAVKKRLSLDVVLMAVASLPVRVVEHKTYEKKIPEARRRIGRRDPDDVEILALAFTQGSHFGRTTTTLKALAVEWFTTAELLALLK